MEIKKRLMIAFLIMTLVPMLLLVGVGTAIIKYRTDTVERAYGVDVDGVIVMKDPVQTMDRLAQSVYDELKEAIAEEPDRLLQDDYLMNVNEKLLDRQAFLLVTKNNRVYFCGNTAYYKMIEDALPQFEDLSISLEGGIYINEEVRCLVKWIDVEKSADEIYSIYVISDVENLIPKEQISAMQVGVVLLVVFIVTGLLVVIWLYNGILKPISKLKDATMRVRDGDLDFSLERTGEDEIGELSADFEEMRSHLKQEIDARISHEQDLRNLIGNISHDLKTPLTTIQGYAEGLLDGVAVSEEKREKYIRTICKKAEDMAHLVEELTLYTQIEGKSYPYYFEVVPLTEFITGLLDENKLYMDQSNTEVRFDFRVKEPCKVLADREQLKRVSLNLMSNAVKYSTKGKGLITVSTEDEGEYVKISVKDNGDGISEEDLPHVFERFYRSDRSRNSGRGGSGLGLSIVKQIVEDHGGKIQVNSVLGKGTTFAFTLLKANEEKNKTNSGGKIDGKDFNY